MAQKIGVETGGGPWDVWQDGYASFSRVWLSMNTQRYKGSVVSMIIIPVEITTT